MKVYHGLIDEIENINEKIAKIKGNVDSLGPILISTSSEITPFPWGNYGLILDVPEENIVLKCGGDASTPTEIPKTSHDLLGVFTYVLEKGGYKTESHFSLFYDEVVIQASPKNKIIGVWYKEGYEIEAKYLLEILKDTTKDNFKIEKYSKYDKHPEITAIAAFSTSIGEYWRSREKRDEIILKHPKGDYYVIFFPAGTKIRSDPYGRKVEIVFRYADAKRMFEWLKNELGSNILDLNSLEKFKVEEDEKYNRYSLPENIRISIFRDPNNKLRVKMSYNPKRNSISLEPMGKQTYAYVDVVPALLTLMAINEKHFRDGRNVDMKKVVNSIKICEKYALENTEPDLEKIKKEFIEATEINEKNL